MKRRYSIWTFSTLVVLLCVSFSSANAQLQPPFFHDDFSDGDAEDGMPVTWIPGPVGSLGTREVVDQNYVLTPTLDEAVVSVPEGLVFGDVSIRTQFRSSGSNWVGVNARSTSHFPGQNIWGTIFPDGELRIGYVVNNTSTPLRITQTGWDIADQDVNLQVDLFVAELSLCHLSHNPCRNRAIIRWSNGFLHFGGMSAGGGCDVPVLEGRV